jgi:predicted Rossmann fold flavoprotein
MTKELHYDVGVVGGGAAGFFAAITAAEVSPGISIVIVEQNKEVLNKVRISGGGRCNVTHACFDPKELVEFYPRGKKELLGPFHKFQPGNTMDWFETRGVPLKIEEDNRVFPESDRSQSIIDCFNREAKKLGVQLMTNAKVLKVNQVEGKWQLTLTGDRRLMVNKLLIATGSSPMMWEMLGSLGHTIVDPVPSLFTFNIQHALIKDLQGISVPLAVISVEGQKLETSGPLLITHWGISGPSVLKMSAWGARLFHVLNYRFRIIVNWTGMDYDQVRDIVRRHGIEHPKKSLFNLPFPGIPQRLWKSMLAYARITETVTWGQLTLEDERRLLNMLVRCQLPVNGKSTFKEEFVTSGGVTLEEVDFRTMESKLCPNLYLAGEVLDIDALTGGFNFQAAWTCGWLAGKAMGKG